MTDYITQNRFPPSPPPKQEPQYCAVLQNPPYETISASLNTYIYVWGKNGCSAWMYPLYFEEEVLYGYVWTDGHWEYIALHYRYIDSIF